MGQEGQRVTKDTIWLFHKFAWNQDYHHIPPNTPDILRQGETFNSQDTGASAPMEEQVESGGGFFCMYT